MNREYIQISHRLHVQRGPGREDLVSERPFTENKKGIRRYTDLDEPTLVRFDQHCHVNVEKLLRIGAIREAPERSRRRPTTPPAAEEEAT